MPARARRCMGMTLVTDLDLPLIDVLDADTTDRVRELTEKAREAGHWIIRTPFGVSVIEHDAVRDLQKDGRLRQLGTRLFEMQDVHGGLAYERFQQSILNIDGDEHTRLRRLVSRPFTPRAVDRHRPMM